MADTPNDTPQALVYLSAMMRSTSLDIAKTTRPILDQTRSQMAQTISEMFNQIDASQMFKLVDASQMFKKLSIVKATDLIDTSQILQFSKTLTEISPQVSRMLQAFRKAVPSNLTGFTELDGLLVLTCEEGIPVAWVPHAEILQLLVAAHDTPTRRQILMDHSDDILADCMTALEDSRVSLKHHNIDIEPSRIRGVGGG